MGIGNKNMYVCRLCGDSVITIAVEDGVTPFMIECKATIGCVGDMYSSFYDVDQSLIPQFEWYKPTLGQYPKKHREYMKHHIKNGGMDIRSVGRLGERETGNE